MTIWNLSPKLCVSKGLMWTSKYFDMGNTLSMIWFYYKHHFVCNNAILRMHFFRIFHILIYLVLSIWYIISSVFISDTTFDLSWGHYDITWCHPCRIIFICDIGIYTKTYINNIHIPPVNFGSQVTFHIT